MAIENWEGKRSKEPMGQSKRRQLSEDKWMVWLALSLLYFERAAERIEEWQSHASAPPDNALAVSSQA